MCVVAYKMFVAFIMNEYILGKKHQIPKKSEDVVIGAMCLANLR